MGGGPGKSGEKKTQQLLAQEKKNSTQQPRTQQPVGQEKKSSTASCRGKKKLNVNPLPGAPPRSLMVRPLYTQAAYSLSTQSEQPLHHLTSVKIFNIPYVYVSKIQVDLYWKTKLYFHTWNITSLHINLSVNDINRSTGGFLFEFETPILHVL